METRTETAPQTDTATILVVDDDEDIRELMEDRLTFLGYSVILAEDGEAGMAHLIDDEPDLVLLDLLMPKLDGLSTIKEIQRREIDVTVIVITAHGTVQSAVEAMQSGAFDFLQKPFRPGDIERKVRRALDRAKLVHENRRLQVALVAAQERLIEDLQGEMMMAHNMQVGLLPEAPPSREDLEFSGTSIPAREVGGDYYTYLEKKSGKVGVVLADVSGKGMQAATVALRFNELIRYEAVDREDPQQILLAIDRSLKGRIPMEMFVTCGIAVFDREASRMTVASAANPETYHYVAAEQRVRPIGLTGFPLGLPLELPGNDPFRSAEIPIQSGDLIVFTSDGIEEAQNAGQDLYGGERLKAVVEVGGREGAPAKTVRDNIVEDALEFTGGVPQTDDMTVCVVRVT